MIPKIYTVVCLDISQQKLAFWITIWRTLANESYWRKSWIRNNVKCRQVPYFITCYSIHTSYNLLTTTYIEVQSLDIGYKKLLAYYVYPRISKNAWISIMIPYYFIPAVNQSSNYQINIQAHLFSAALKQGNTQALKAQLNYDCSISIHRLLSNSSNVSIMP